MDTTTKEVETLVRPFGHAELRQAQLEIEAREAGIARTRELIERARDKGEWSLRTQQGRHLLASHVAVFAAAIRWAQENGKAISAYRAGGSMRGPKVVYLREMLSVRDEVIAAITLSAMMEAAECGATFSSTASLIGRRLEEEAQVLWIEKNEPDFLVRFVETLRNQGSRAGYAARRLNIEMRGKLASGWEAWTPRVRYQFGLALATAAVELTPLFVTETVTDQLKRGQLKSRIHVGWSPEATDALKADLRQLEDRAGKLWPMVCPPNPWTGTHDGGYLTLAVPRQPLVRGASREHVELLRERPPVEVMAALNRVQATPWQVNLRVLDVLRRLWDQGGGTLGLPVRWSADRAPVKPDAPTADELLAYKKEARRFYTWAVKEQGEARRVGSILDAAVKFGDEPELYFPHNLDFRGRVYPIPSVLQPQGDDVQRGLLQFAEGKALRYEEDADWLAIHGANTYGYDKAGLDERVEWVREHEPAILALAADPLSEESRAFLETADKPFQFLAWAFEWADYRQSPGEGFVSRIPVSLDGTCNGLQHLSAMARDERGGSFVNLAPTPDGKPADVYAEVARRTAARLEEIVWLGEGATTDEERNRARWAKGWLAFGIDRKLTKRTVMVVPYGGTMRANLQYVRQAVRESGREHGFEEGDDFRGASLFLAGVVWDALSDVLVRAREVMTWLQTCARELAKQGKPVVWTTPVGFTVRQAYMEMAESRVSFGVRREHVQLRVTEPTPKLNSREQASGMSPNFTHSLDAAHLVATVNRAAEEFGLTQWSMVHDSYGVPAADVSVLTGVLRAEFASMYLDPDAPLHALAAELRAQAEDPSVIPDPPAAGSWDATQVVEAPFFFH